MSEGKLFVVSGPSGAGKGTLVALLREDVADMWLSKSATTRNARSADTTGESYHYLDKDTFKKMIDENGFLEWAVYSDNYYGTPRKPVEENRAAGYHAILEIDVQGAMQVREKLPEAHLIFIEPPSMEELERRLRSRGTDKEEDITKRLEAAAVEMARKGEYDIVITNDDLQTARGELVAYVKSIIED